MEPERPAIECAENIALLSLLTEKPERAAAKSSPQAGLACDASGRRLSLDDERQLTRTLAFLSGTTGDPNHVTAIAVEEDVIKHDLKVMLAINKANRLSATAMMEQLKEGLQRLLKALSRITARETQQMREHRVTHTDGRVIENRERSQSIDEIFNIIVDFCRTRVLRRLRSTKVKALFRKQDKRFMAVHLRSFTEALRSNGFKCPQGVDKHLVLSQIEALVRLLEDFEAGRCESLAEVLINLGQFHDSVQLDTILLAISDKDMDPSLKDYLSDQIPKLVRYREAAVFLSSLARKTEIFKLSTVVPVFLDEKFFQRETIPGQGPSLPACFSRAQSGQRHLMLSEAYEKLRIPSEAAARSAFSSTAREILREAKIHAEIQIAAFYHRNPAPNPPRFVFSSKDACYLCSTFLRLHGCFQLPKSHGRLYPGWRLPNDLFPSSLELKFNTILEADIRHNLDRLLKSPKKLKIMHPNESTLSLLIIPSTPSTTSLHRSSSSEGGTVESSNTSPSSCSDDPSRSTLPEAECTVTKDVVGTAAAAAPKPLATIVEEEAVQVFEACKKLEGTEQAELSPVAKECGKASAVSEKELVRTEVVDVDVVHVEDVDAETVNMEAEKSRAQEDRAEPKLLPVEVSSPADDSSPVDDSGPADAVDRRLAKEIPSHALSVSNKKTQTIRFSTKALELFIEIESTRLDSRPRSVPDIDLDWLQGEELMRTLSGADPLTFNMKDLPEGVDVDSGSPDVFRLVVGETAVRINISRE